MSRTRAPAKGFVQFKDGGHFVMFTQSDAFLDLLVKRVRPLATRDDRASGPES